MQNAEYRNARLGFALYSEFSIPNSELNRSNEHRSKNLGQNP